MINRVKLGVMVLLAVFALVYVSEVRAVEVENGINVTGSWAIKGQWTGGAPWNDVLTLKQKGKKVTGQSSGGIKLKGTVKGSKISFNVLADCYPTYIGTVTNTSMKNGTMKCKNTSDSGTWSAKKVGKATESSGASIASPGE